MFEPNASRHFEGGEGGVREHVSYTGNATRLYMLLDTQFMFGSVVSFRLFLPIHHRKIKITKNLVDFFWTTR